MTAFRIVIAAIVWLWSIAAYAQVPAPPTGNPDAPDKTAGGPQTPATGQENPNGNPPNPDAPMNPALPGATSGPEIVDDPNATPEQKASAEYSGPAVLSRGISASEPMNPQNVKFTPNLGLEYIFNSGLTGVNLQPNGTLANATSSGAQLNYGLSGEKLFKRDTFGLSFYGTLTHYAQASEYDGSSDSLSLTWRHKISRHLSFGVRVSAQEYNQNNLLLSGADYINSGVGTTLVTASPSTEVFDGRVFSFYTQGDVTYQLNSRLSINLSGAGFLTRRASSSLYGDTGSQASADIAYRFTRHVTAGVYYSYTYFDFIGIYGATDVNTVGVTYSIAFTPHTELITRLGGSRLESTGLSSIALNPVLALLLGTPSTLEAVYQVNYTPDMNVQLRHKVANWDLSLAYARGVTPGNGVILTSIRQSASFGANKKLGRLWDFNGTGGYDTLTGFGTTNSKYASVFFGGSLTRKLIKNLSWHARFDYHHYTFDNTGFLRNNYVIASGVIWTPGDLLEHVW